MQDIKLDRAALTAFLTREFPQVAQDFEIRAVGAGTLAMALRVQDKHLRPGGTVSGPAMFALADVAVYLSILSMIGPQALAVTTGCSMDFMRKPSADNGLVAHVELLKLGRNLAVGDVRLRTDNATSHLVSRASLTYSIP